MPEKLRGFVSQRDATEFGDCRWSLGTARKEAANLILRRQGALEQQRQKDVFGRIIQPRMVEGSKLYGGMDDNVVDVGWGPRSCRCEERRKVWAWAEGGNMYPSQALIVVRRRILVSEQQTT
jgi:hypothetical protein